MSVNRPFDPASWDRKEFDWTGKSFYFVEFFNILGMPIGLGSKVEELNRELRKNGYKALSPMILIQHTSGLRGRVMIEVEKKDQYDAQVYTLDTQTSADCVAVLTGKSGLSKGIERIKQQVSSRRDMNPRMIFYWCVEGIDNPRNIVVFGLT